MLNSIYCLLRRIFGIEHKEYEERMDTYENVIEHLRDTLKEIVIVNYSDEYNTSFEKTEMTKKILEANFVEDMKKELDIPFPNDN